MIGHIGKAALDAVREVVNTILVAVVVGDMVLKGHLLARNDITLRKDLDAIAKQHDLFDVIDWSAVQGNGRIRPSDDTRLGVGVLGRNGEVFDFGDQSVIDIGRDEIKDGSLAIVEVAAIGVEGVNGKIVVVEATPTPVEVEFVVALTIATANESMTARRVTTRIIERETIFQVTKKHGFPFRF